MKYIARMMLLLTLVHSPGGAHDHCSKAECAAVKEKIRTVESKMRAGYTRAQGERYAARLRELRSRRAKLCR